MFKEDILKMTNEIQMFKNEFESKYNKNINILVSEKSDVVVNVRQWEDSIIAMKEAHQIKTIEILEKLVLGTMRSLYPEFKGWKTLKKECRKREFVIFKNEDLNNQLTYGCSDNTYRKPIKKIVLYSFIKSL